MNDIKFLQHYNETAIDNFVAVVKQNILFQAQIAALAEENKRIPELLREIDSFEEVKKKLVELNEANVNLANQLNIKNQIAEKTNKVDTERFRLQTAVNTQMKEINGLKEALEEQQEYIKKLENMLPPSKKKKLGIESNEIEDQVSEEITQEEPTVDNEEKETLSTGGTF
jgi:predicted ribosome quality control (RQC) complex YloA/Tae2 family protein